MPMRFFENYFALAILPVVHASGVTHPAKYTKAPRGAFSYPEQMV